MFTAIIKIGLLFDPINLLKSWMLDTGEGMIIMENVKRIIVVDLLYLGDLLFAHPFFEGLRELFPEARIDLVANSNFSEIMRVNPNIDHVYSYNKNWTVVRSYKFAKKLEMNNYQLGINIHGNWRTALLLKLISADKITICYQINSGLREKLP